MPGYYILTRLAGAVCAVLAGLWLAVPDLLFMVWGMPADAASAAAGRRSGSLFAGLAMILFLLRDCRVRDVRRAVSTGFALSCAILSVLGMHAFHSGGAGPGILAAVAVELLFAAAFWNAARLA